MTDFPPAGPRPPTTNEGVQSAQPTSGTTAIIPPLSALAAPPVPRTITSNGASPTMGSFDVNARNPSQRGSSIADAEVSESVPQTARMVRVVAPVEPRPPAAPLALRAPELPAPRPAISGPFDPRIVLLAEPYSPRAASFRLLRDSLMAKSMPRVLAVSSAAPKDGKTTCSINLAFAFAEQPGTRVLLVDGNFFAPELGSIFSIDRLAPVTLPDGEAWLSPFKLVEINPGLHVAGIERRPGEPAARFDPPRFEALIERLVRVSYDFILIDAPALRGTPEVTQMLGAADATLLAVRSGGTTASELRRAAEQIPPKKALGIALIDALPRF